MRFHRNVLVFGCLAAVAAAFTLRAQTELTVASLNIHYLSLRDPELLNWDERKAGAAKVLGEAEADIIALQETETFAGGSWNARNLQLEYLLDALPRYSAVAVGDPKHYPSTQPVLILKDRFELIEQGFFFYSEQPDEIYSRSWDGRFPAFTSWVRLRDRASGMRFYLYNLHLDAGSSSNRRRATELNLERIADRTGADDPVIVAGDFNAFGFFPTLRRFRRGELSLAPGAGSTYHFNRGLNLLPAIDHLLYSEEFSHLETRVLRRKPYGVWPSDHYPLVVSLRIGE